MDRPVGRAAGRPAARDRPRPLRRRHQFRAPASHARRALEPRARRDRVDRHRGGARRCRASSRCGPRPTSPTSARSISARGRSRSLRPTASRCWRPTRCATSASRWPRCSPTIPTSPRTPPIWSTSTIEELPPILDAPRRARRVLAGRDTEAAVLRQGYGDVEAVFASARAYRRAEADQSAATPACRWRRAARSAATMRRATCSSCTAPPRCRIATRS